MPIKNNPQNTPEIITVDDLYHLATLANCDMDWMQVAIEDTKLRVAKIKEDLTKHYPNAEYHFRALEKVLEMYSYLVDDRTRHYEEEAERIGLLANKKAVTL